MRQSFMTPFFDVDAKVNSFIFTTALTLSECADSLCKVIIDVGSRAKIPPLGHPHTKMLLIVINEKTPYHSLLENIVVSTIVDSI